MRIKQASALTLEEMKAISDLEKAAFRPYHLENHAFLSNEINFDHSIPTFLLGYEGERLVAFLSMFIPTPQEAELSAVTHPDFQRRGCFTRLFAAAGQILRQAQIDRVLFVLEPGSESGLAAIKSFAGTELDHSEYRMSLTERAPAPHWEPLQFSQVDGSNRALFAEMLRQIHPDMDDRENYVATVVESDTRRGYIAYKELPIGVFNLNYEHDQAFLYGVGIKESYRGQGLGKKLIGYAIAQGLKNAPRLVLDVDSHNPAAFHIYQQYGFQIDFQVDYYRYRLQAIQ